MTLGQQKGGVVARGVAHGSHRQHVCRFDDEMFARVRAKAERDGTSFSEAIRTLVEWGLEVEEAG